MRKDGDSGKRYMGFSCFVPVEGFVGMFYLFMASDFFIRRVVKDERICI